MVCLYRFCVALNVECPVCGLLVKFSYILYIVMYVKSMKTQYNRKRKHTKHTHTRTYMHHAHTHTRSHTQTHKHTYAHTVTRTHARTHSRTLTFGTVCDPFIRVSYSTGDPNSSLRFYTPAYLAAEERTLSNISKILIIRHILDVNP